MKKVLISTYLLLGVALFASCSKTTTVNNNSSVSSEEINESVFSATVASVSVPSTSEVYSSESSYSATSNTVEVALNDADTTITNNNGYCLYSSPNIIISGAGTYLFTGKLASGGIIVEATANDKVYIVLNGVSITSSISAAINSRKSDKTFVDLVEGSVNYLCDAQSYTYDNTNEEPNACLFSKNDLTIRGNGTLTVVGNFNNGIGTKDDLKIKDSPTINVTAVNNAIKGNDSIEIENASITAKSTAGDCIKVDNTEDADKGYITITNGTFNLTASDDAIDVSTLVTIIDGTFSIITGASSSTGLNSTTSSKGIVCAGDIAISGGSFNFNTQDDSLNSNANLTIDGGDYYISSGDDGIHADTTLTINSGAINIVKSYEGIESTAITINGGKIKIKSSDDGVNAAGGVDSSSSTTNKPFGGFGGATSTSTGTLTINGGYIYVDASGDGLDANGSITMTGGTAIVNGPTDNGNGPLDYDSTFAISGGLLIACGSSGMAQNISSNSTQYGILVNFSKSYSAGTMISILDSDGNNILTFAPTKTFQSICVSTSSFTKGTTYTFKTGGTYTGGSVLDGLYTGGTYTGGTTAQSVTINSIVTGAGSTSNTPGMR